MTMENHHAGETFKLASTFILGPAVPLSFVILESPLVVPC